MEALLSFYGTFRFQAAVWHDSRILEILIFVMVHPHNAFTVFDLCGLSHQLSYLYYFAGGGSFLLLPCCHWPTRHHIPE